MKWSLVFTFFRSLNLEHLERSLYSLSKQTAKPDEYIFFDNCNGVYSEEEICSVIERRFDLRKWRLFFDKRGGNCRTLSWGNNHAIRLANHNHFLLTRADIIYDYTFCRQMLIRYDNNPNRFVTSWVLYVGNEDETVDYEKANWRTCPENLIAAGKTSVILKASHQDTASFITSQTAMDKAGWYDETLVGWGFDQQDLQTQLKRAGVEMLHAPWVMQYHQFHSLVDGDARDLKKAMEIWKRSPRRVPEILEAERLQSISKP